MLEWGLFLLVVVMIKQILLKLHCDKSSKVT